MKQSLRTSKLSGALTTKSEGRDALVDNLLRYASESAAKADKTLAGFLIDGNWDTSRCIPDAKVWRVTGTSEGPDGAIETREYLSGWFILITSDDAAITGSTARILSADRKKAAPLARSPSVDFSEYQFGPVMAGSGY